MAATEIVCPMCGFKNPATAARCSSCGARVEAFGPGDLSDDEELAKRHQQEGFEWKWVLVSFSIYFVMQAFIIGLLPLVISSYDPQGLPGLVISGIVWFCGGIVVGFISPGKTFVEPAVGALLAVIPTVAYIVYISDVHQLSMLAYIVAGLLGVMFTLIGAFLGEKIQMGTRGHSRA